MDPKNLNDIDQNDKKTNEMVGSVRKEEGPISDYLKLNKETPELHPEVGEVGAETVTHEEPKITPDHEQIGIVKTIPEPRIESTEKVEYPIDPQKAQVDLVKEKDTSKSVVWLMVSIIRDFLKKRARGGS